MSTEEKAEALPANAIDCWVTNYGLDRNPFALAELWKDGAPMGAALALKAATAELRRLYAENERLRADAALVRAQALEEAARVCEDQDTGQGLLHDESALDCAEAIRALKASPDAKG